MRLVPATDTVPASVNRYLLPHESQVISVHQHPAVLIGRTFLVLAGFVIASWLSISVAHGNGTALLIIWVLWGLLLAWLAVKVLDIRFLPHPEQLYLEVCGLMFKDTDPSPD